MKKNDLFEKTQIVAEKVMSTAKKQLSNAEAYLDSKKEPLKIKIEISCKKSELDKKYAEYGKACYEDSEDKDIIKEAIDYIVMEIEELNEKLAEMVPDNKIAEEATYCTGCGKKASEGDAFCSSCGTELKK